MPSSASSNSIRRTQSITVSAVWPVKSSIPNVVRMGQRKVARKVSLASSSVGAKVSWFLKF